MAQTKASSMTDLFRKEATSQSQGAYRERSCSQRRCAGATGPGRGAIGLARNGESLKRKSRISQSCDLAEPPYWGANGWMIDGAIIAAAIERSTNS
jgi:hypothetical protein